MHNDMKVARIASLTVGSAFIAALVGIYGVFIENNNFREYASNEVYRSGQLEGGDWLQYHHDYRFKSVLNLRGKNTGKDWYDEEISFMNANGILHENLSLSSDKEPDMKTMQTLVDMMRTAPKPLLIHCMQGADRTGLAMALYSYAIEGKPVEEAEEQLSLYYGHFPWVINGTGAMDRAFAKYVAAHPLEGDDYAKARSGIKELHASTVQLNHSVD